ncbi:extracellular solute-binding protein [Mycolicibacterium sp. CBM1]
MFNSETGVKALTVLQQMAVTDMSINLDTTNSNGTKLMNSGKIGMLVTGPWDLSSLSDIQYGVQMLPTFAGSSGGHQTISGPDNWVVFDNGEARKKAAVDFVKWDFGLVNAALNAVGISSQPFRRDLHGQPADEPDDGCRARWRPADRLRGRTPCGGTGWARCRRRAARTRDGASRFGAAQRCRTGSGGLLRAARQPCLGAHAGSHRG